MRVGLEEEGVAVVRLQTEHAASLRVVVRNVDERRLGRDGRLLAEHRVLKRSVCKTSSVCVVVERMIECWVVLHWRGLGTGRGRAREAPPTWSSTTDHSASATFEHQSSVSINNHLSGVGTSRHLVVDLLGFVGERAFEGDVSERTERRVTTERLSLRLDDLGRALAEERLQLLDVLRALNWSPAKRFTVGFTLSACTHVVLTQAS